MEELKGAGLLNANLPRGISIPLPSDDSALREDEDPLDGGLFDEFPSGLEES